MNCFSNVTPILDDLLDLTRSSFGTDIPVSKSETDIAALSETIADELRNVHANHTIDVVVEGDPNRHWDAARLGQTLSKVSVHNSGTPIPADVQKIIFQSRTRGQVEGSGRHPHLGLGLNIARLITEAHGGQIASRRERPSPFDFPELGRQDPASRKPTPDHLLRSILLHRQMSILAR